MTLKFPNLTWRTRKRMKLLALTLGSLAALALALWVCWILWLGRFVVYSRDGVRLDFDWVRPGEFVVAAPPEHMDVNIRYEDGLEVPAEPSGGLPQLTGSTISLDMLTGDIAQLDQIIREQPKDTAVLLELKAGNGTFYYDTNMPGASVSDHVDTEALSALLTYLAKADYYTIAAVPAFRDRAYALENPSLGIPHASGGYLWAGADNAYWLDPAKEGTRTRLKEIAKELRDLGFDEVLFTDFSFPPTDAILYEGDKTAVLNETAQHLVYNLATTDFCVSFLCNTEGFVLPEGRTRLYRSGVDAAQAQTVADSLGVADAQVNLVFLTEAKDTRFDEFSVLRPLPLDVTQLPPADETPEETEPPEEPVAEPAQEPAE